MKVNRCNLCLTANFTFENKFYYYLTKVSILKSFIRKLILIIDINLTKIKNRTKSCQMKNYTSSEHLTTWRCSPSHVHVNIVRSHWSDSLINFSFSVGYKISWEVIRYGNTDPSTSVKVTLVPFFNPLIREKCLALQQHQHPVHCLQWM
jgi:hypothetical protein